MMVPVLDVLDADITTREAGAAFAAAAFAAAAA
jgi:hypothetical protein